MPCLEGRTCRLSLNRGAGGQVPTGCEWPPTFVEPRLLFSLCLRRGGLFYPPPSLLAAQERWPPRPRPRDVDGLCPNVAGLWPRNRCWTAWAQSSPASGHVTSDVFYSQSQERPSRWCLCFSVTLTDSPALVRWPEKTRQRMSYDAQSSLPARAVPCGNKNNLMLHSEHERHKCTRELNICSAYRQW